MPILQAPMAGACPASLASAVATAGGMGGLGALTTSPDGIADWVREFRDRSNGGYQINLWIPDPPPVRDLEHEREVREFLGKWGPPVPAEASDAAPLDFAAQCEALLAAAPRVISSIMGLFPDKFIAEIKTRGIAWFACVTTLAEARAAVATGADAIVAQGSEAGGHRGAFDAAAAERQSVGLFALVPRLADPIAHRRGHCLVRTSARYDPNLPPGLLFSRFRLCSQRCVVMAVFGLVYFALLDTKVLGLILLAVARSGVPVMTLYGPEAALIVESFSPRLRYSGCSLGYQLASIIAGGPSVRIQGGEWTTPSAR
jgi:hypothetical protein